MCAQRVHRVFDRRQQLIDAARTLFANRPYDEVTTSEIAKRAGVAYGLIAHHFENKRGLYRAVMGDIAAEITAVQRAAPPPHATLVDTLRHALRNHISYIDDHAESFVALVRGHLGSDREQQDAVAQLRWLGIAQILQTLGIPEPVPPTLRVALHGWVAYLDEMMIQRINADDVGREALVELGAAALVSTFASYYALENVLTPPALLAELIDAFEVDTAALTAQ